MANVVLVHGAWCDASSWIDVVEPLQASGHTVLGVQLPLTSLADDIAVTRKAIATLSGPVGLVGHSYGGAVIGGASADNQQVVGLVYVAAYAPDEGETVLSLGERYPATAGAGAIRATDDGWLTLDPEQYASVFAADVVPARARALSAVQKPTHGACFGSPSGPQGWHARPVAYVRSVADQMINPDLQSWMAERMDAAVTDLDSSHASPVSHGAAVAEVLASVLAG